MIRAFLAPLLPSGPLEDAGATGPPSHAGPIMAGDQHYRLFAMKRGSGCR
jgi:hypothetical protein